jgi:glycosyltransferase involved in cell wall biosynthesis
LNNPILVSIVVPFRSFEILARNLLSAFKFSIENVEVLLIHDSKEDLNQEQIQTISSKIKRYSYLRYELNSPGLARNKGLEIARGEWIVFWDSDDFGYPEVLLDLVSRAESGILIANFQRHYQDEQSITRDVLNVVNEEQLVRDPGLWRFIFHRSEVESSRFEALKLGEDILFLVGVGAFEKEYQIFQDTMYEYHISVNQSTKRMDIQPNLALFIDRFTTYLEQTRTTNAIILGVYWRQLFSSLKRSKGTTFVQCSRHLFKLSATRNPKFVISLMVGLKYALIGSQKK